MDRYIVPSLRHQVPQAVAVRGLGWVSLAYLATLALGFAFMYFQVRVMQKVGQDTMYDLRKEIFEHLQRLPISFYDHSPVGRLVTRVTTDVDALNDLFATGIAAMVNDAFLLVLFVFVMLYINWKLALATFAVIPCFSCAPGSSATRFAMPTAAFAPPSLASTHFCKSTSAA